MILHLVHDVELLSNALALLSKNDRLVITDTKASEIAIQSLESCPGSIAMLDDIDIHLSSSAARRIERIGPETWVTEAIETKDVISWG